MTKFIDLSRSKQYELPFYKEEQARHSFSIDKGWSYSYVYHFIELKNVFIALKQIPYQGKDDFSKRAIKSGLPFEKTPWDSRRILEQLNGLINFGLITKEYKIKNNFFSEITYTNALSESDYDLFKKIYHEYFRFKEIHSWLLNPVQENHTAFLNNFSATSLACNSCPIFPFSINSRFNNAFIFSLADNADIYKISDDSGDMMRFWDVYIKWGQELNLIEKFNMKSFDFELSNNQKSFSCAYYINSEKPNLDLLKFIRSEYQGNSIHIPKLILKMALRFRYRITEIKEMIIEQALANSNSISLQRTSEIFIRKTEIDFFPIYKNSYISHLQLQ